MKRPETFSIKIICVLFFLTCIIYSQVANHEFLQYDDNQYISENPHLKSGITSQSLNWILKADLTFNSAYADYWQPMNFLSHAVLIHLFGLNSSIHHLFNAFFHLINAILIYFIFNKITGARWQSAILSVVFLIHPMQVEAVAWLSARKDVLSTFFGILAIWNYVSWVQSRKLRSFAGVCSFMSLSLLSKPMLITLPVLLLVMDCWPLKRISSRGTTLSAFNLIKEKIPLFAISLSYAILVKAIAKSAISASPTISIERMRLDYMLLNIVGYLWKLIMPVNIVIALPEMKLFPPSFALAAGVVVILISLFCFLLRKRHLYLMFGWLFFLISLLPIIVVAPQSRFTYFPMIGILAAFTWGLSDWFSKMGIRRNLVAMMVVGWVVCLTAVSFRQVSYWKTSYLLFKNMAEIDPSHYAARVNLASFYAKAGDLEGAIREVEEVIRIKPDFAPAHNSFAILLSNKNDFLNSEKEFQKAIELAPAFSVAYGYYGQLLERLGRDQEAIEQYLTALKIEPDSADWHLKISKILSKYGKTDLANQHWQQAILLNPDLVNS